MKAIVGKNMRKIIGLLFGVMCFAAVMQTDVAAAGTVSVTADKTAASVGETVTVTVQTSAPEDPATIPEVSVTYNADILTFAGCDVEYGGGGGGLLTFTGQTATMTFTAAQPGDVSVGAEAIIDDDGNNPAVGTATITVGAQGGMSSDATLYALEMNPGQMVPEFSPQVTDYKIIIENDVTDITVSGAVSDPGAQITAASGFKDLKEGTNEAIITVTAADGTTLSYHFSIERSEAAAEEDEEATGEETENNQVSNGLEVTIDDVHYTVQTVVPDEILPEGCSKTSSSFNGEAVEAALFEKGGLTLLYALADDGSGDFFIYNEATGKLQLFLQLRSIENRYIIPIEGTEGTPATFKESKMQWNNSYIPAYVLADTSVEHADEFYLLYAVNNEGERAFYLYDTMEGTYQRFLNYTGAKSVAVNNNVETKPFVIAIIILSVLLAGAVMLIVNMIISGRERREDERYERRARAKKPVKKPAARPQPKSQPKQEKRLVPEEKTEAEEAAVEVKKPQPKSQPKPAVRKTVMPQPVSEQKETMQQPSKQVAGAVSTTGSIPIKVVQPPKPEVKRPQVPIYTLERQPVQLTREAPPDQLDDDFEFEFISMDNE